VTGSITIGGLVFAFAPGATLTGATLGTGSTFCLQGTVTSGQISSVTVSVPLAATPVYAQESGWAAHGRAAFTD
jgi:hypothetical protein